ncbi:dTMP kinase [Mitsuaria sp. WAJ17]|uniref:dTMP kinase n=1 Tax=Mitsuaria sp. WAJ17 TaxID=2761452 RepID=UPI001603ADF4|nr:dTMP kinase [Mitsuaria sp. WAJ17]MBB2486368.1 dTMP kinase [Mitsuaria sp. WAJ17]
MSGRFISFEGIDGAGKSTHIAAVSERLRRAGAEVLNTREPGGTPLAERLRELVLHEPMDALTEALLVFAGRRDHVRKVIEPALAAGCTVVCDRFTDASFAYQGGGNGLPLSVLTQLEAWVTDGRQPDLTIWFDLPPAMAAARRAAAREADRFEQQDLDFFERVRAAYAARAADAPQRFAQIDASGDVASVATQIVAVLEQRGW